MKDTDPRCHVVIAVQHIEQHYLGKTSKQNKNNFGESCKGGEMGNIEFHICSCFEIFFVKVRTPCSENSIYVLKGREVILNWMEFSKWRNEEHNGPNYILGKH